MDMEQEVVKKAAPFLLAAALAWLGGTVSYFNKLRERDSMKFTWLAWTIECITSVFVGLIVQSLCLWAHLDIYLSAALVALSGHQAGATLRQLQKQRAEKLRGLIK